MRLIDSTSRNVSQLALILGLVVAVGACGRGADAPTALSSANSPTARLSVTGPAEDYPMVLGDPYFVDGKLFTPVDTTSYDEVGYAAPDAAGGAAVTVSHKTLPLPSYVEITSLVTGKTILARVERRGPMTNDRVIALSPGAQFQLGSADGAPVRVRRVNPPEFERAKLRTGDAVMQRMDTPQSLVAVLKRKLPARGSALPLSTAEPTNSSTAVQKFDTAFKHPTVPVDEAKTANYALAPLVRGESAVTAAPVVTQSEQLTALAPANAAGQLVVQAATFSSETSARKVASTLGGFVMPAGKYYRVRVGPFINRGQADAALAKVHAAGYRDATVSTAG